MLGRRGPAQAAFTNPELKELGELAGADVIVDPADLVLDPASAAALADARGTARRNVDLLHEYAARPAGGQAAAAGPPLPRLAGRDPRRREGRGGRGRAQRARRRRARQRPRRRDRGARDDPVQHRPAQRRLPRASRCPGVPFDDDRGRHPERRGAASSARRRADPGPLLRGLDQARPERRDRHEQEGRGRDRRARCSRTPRPGCSSRGRGRPRGAARSSAALPFVEYAGWEAIDAHERCARRAARAAAGQARTWDELLGAAARSGAEPEARLDAHER